MGDISLLYKVVELVMESTTSFFLNSEWTLRKNLKKYFLEVFCLILKLGFLFKIVGL